MRMKMAATLAPGLLTPAHDPLARRVCGDDVAALAELMWESYRGTVDDGGETLEDAVGEVERLLAGTYGAFDPDASEVVERDGTLASATLVTRYEGLPLVAFSMTAPTWKRRGLARAGLVRAMTRLAERGEARVQLAVTKANAPAVALYVSLGFAEVER